MHKKHSKIKLRAALLSLVTIALLAATAAFIGTSAAEAVSDSDLAASNSDAGNPDIVALADEIPDNLGAPKITMTTSKAVDETLSFELNIPSAYVDWGDGNIVQSTGKASYEYYYYKSALVGQTVKVYSTEDITSFVCGDIDLTELDVTKNTALTALGCEGNNLTELDVTKNTALTTLNCGDNNLTELDVTKNTALTILFCYENKLTELDVTKNVALEELFCGYNNLTELDVTKNTALTYLNCSASNLTELDVTKNTALNTLHCNYNHLTELDVTKNVALSTLYCYENNLTKLDVTKNTALTDLHYYENNLKFSTIKLNASMYLGVYYTQADVSIVSSIKAGATIDLSSEYEVNGKNTVYKWYDSADNEVTPTKSENGVFTFGDEFVGKTLYCTMTNEFFPDLTLKTTSVEILEAGLIVEDNTGDVEDAEPSDGMVVRDKDGNIVDLKGVKLVISDIETNKKKSVLEAIERYNKEFDADSDDCALYDISLVDKNGAKVYIEDGGRIKVRLKYPDNLGRQSEDYSYHLYHQKDDGSIEEIEIHCEPNGIWFYADEFSPYALTWSLKSSGGTTDTGKGPSTGESIAMTVVASCLAVLSLAAIGAVLYKKKFAVPAK